jgi:hypothetical protein
MISGEEAEVGKVMITPRVRILRNIPLEESQAAFLRRLQLLLLRVMGLLILQNRLISDLGLNKQVLIYRHSSHCKGVVHRDRLGILRI